MEFENTVAFVSGGASGIGRAAAIMLAARGTRLVVADIDDAGAAETVDAVEATGGTAVAAHCDTTVSRDLEAAFATAYSRFGRLDIVFNNAGVGGEALFEDEAEAWKRVVDINLTAVIDATRLAVRLMKASGRGGVIVNTASMGGLLPMPGSPVYAATKAGVVNLCRSLGYLALESGIRVNAICPSYVDTPLVRRGGEEKMNELAAQLGGILQPEDIAAGVVELVEDDSRAGAIMRVTVRGGRDYARDIRA